MQGKRDICACRSTSEPPFFRARCSVRPPTALEDRAPTNFVPWPPSRPSVVTFCQVPYYNYRMPPASAPSAMPPGEDRRGSDRRGSDPSGPYSPMKGHQDQNRESYGCMRTPGCSVAESGKSQMGPRPQYSCGPSVQQEDSCSCEPEEECPEPEEPQGCCPQPCEEPKPKKCRRRRKPRCCYVITHEQGVQTDDAESETKESQTLEPEIIEVREITVQETEVTHRTGEKEIEVTEEKQVTQVPKFPASGQFITEVQKKTKAGKVLKSGEGNVTESGNSKTRVEDAKGTAAIVATTDTVLDSLNPTLEPNVVESLKFGLRAKASSIPPSAATSPIRRRSHSFLNNQKVVRPKDYPDMKRVKVTSGTTSHLTTGPRKNSVTLPQRRPSETRRSRPSAGSQHMILVSADAPRAPRRDEFSPDRQSTLQVVTTKRKEAAMMLPDSEGKLQEMSAVLESKVTELHVRKDDKSKRKRPDTKMKYGYPSNDLVTRMERPPRRNHCCLPYGGCPYSCSYSSYYNPCSRCDPIYGFGGHCAQCFGYP
ncbi:uncharacterized protein Dana_GF13299 [Drosophila ananassae]|uniref:Uncharacterized protein n=1 Tax=Drosophila ananassae TaxID=7217 RepID=B3MBL8_DROAN|nr:uncharacterized protein LOC6496141 [Drosophila ananassae]EDV37149.1 uncharacterized protein Dana_GF13299 [Drosophila ananassae]